jgi:ubiquinone/menaquinone biosynthesis C-methylase UbiE
MAGTAPEATHQLEELLPTAKGMLKRGLDLALAPLGLATKDRLVQDRAEGFPAYVEAARRAGMDVNDYEEEVMGWLRPLPILEQVVFPLLREDSVVCELGPGTGRWSRHIAARLARGELHLVDHSPWLVDFLRAYFRGRPNVRVHLGDGHRLPFERNTWLDLVFATGTLVEFKLGMIYGHSREFYRLLKPGGYVVFDYIDPTTPEGWAHLESGVLPDVYTFHAPQVLDRVFESAGFEIVLRRQVKKSTYLTVQRPTAPSQR